MADITGAGLDSSFARLINSHLPALALKSTQAEQLTRKPMLLLRLSALLLLRCAERQLRGLLFHEPPRSSSIT